MKVVGIKIGMTQVFDDDRAFGVTLIKFADAEMVAGFSRGDRVKVRGVTKGKGFQGVVKRYGFAGGPKTHGQKDRHRAPGSIGSTAPQRVLPGRRMAGRMGGKNRTIKNLTIVEVRGGERILVLHGSVPGNRGICVEVAK